MKQIFSTIKVLALALIFSVGVSSALAWTVVGGLPVGAPVETTPTGNFSLILNTSDTAQFKPGSLGIGTTVAPSAKLTVGTTPGGADSSFYDIGAGKIAAGTSIYSYGGICSGESNGNCQGTGGTVMSPTGIRFPDGSMQTTSATNSISARTNFVNSPDGDRNPNTKLPITSGQGVRFDFAQSAYTGTGGTYAGVMTYAPWDGSSASTGDASYQLAFGSAAVNGSGVPQLKIRNGIDSTWNGWKQILTDDGAGNVGIGTTAPSNKLVIEGTAPVAEIRTGGYLMLRPTANDWDMRLQAVAGNKLNVLSGGDLVNPIATFVHGGAVGIGTTNPQLPLDIQKNVADANPSLRVYNQNTGGGTGLNISGANNTYNSLLWTNGSTGDLSFQTQTPTYNANNIRMIIQNGGNVGIGTTAPTQKLQINGITRFRNNDFPAEYFTLYDDGTNRYTGGVDTDGFYLTTGDRGFAIRNYAGSQSATRFYVSSNSNGGNVGIGTTNPLYKLHVSGGDIGLDQPYAMKFANGQAIRDNGAGGLALTSGASINNTAASINNTVMPGGYTITGSDAVINGVTVGRGAGAQITNTAVGNSALASNSNTAGNQNTAVGFSALATNVAGGTATAIGAYAMSNSYNGASGFESGNTAVGYAALKGSLDASANTGVYNTAVGSMSLYKNVTGLYNTASGFTALYNNTTGYNNTAQGVNALYSNTTGFFNTATGSNALSANTIGTYNTTIGAAALSGNTSGYSNTAVGYSALSGNSTGYQNTAVGYGAGASGALFNTTAIGSGAVPSASNYVRIGNTTVTQIGGQVGWSALSDARQKENVVDYNHGLDFIMKLRPVTYNLIADKTKAMHSGFIAQEVEATGVPFYGLNKPANKNDFYSLNYSEFVVPLVNSVKELKTENDSLNAKVDKLQADNAALLARIEKIEARLK